jgi:ribosome-binding protein aMBF1 (putative translation factor)
MTKLNDKLSKLATAKPSDWKAQAKYRRDNREWLRWSAAIAVKVLDALKAQGLTQKDLAERMDVSPQQISKIVGGQENLTLQTIFQLESILGIHIINVNSGPKKSAA